MKKFAVIVGIIILWITAVSVVYGALVPEKDRPEQASAASYISSKMKECTNSGCYKDVAKDFLYHYTLPQVLGVFEQNEEKEEFFENCHQVAHFLGQEAYHRKKDIRKVFSDSTRACLGGTYHGAVEGYLIEKEVSLDIADSNIEVEIPKICGTAEDYSVPQEFTECNHGMGHGLMYLTENDLVESLKLCDLLPTRNQQQLCYTGALMANADSAGSKDHPAKYVKADDPLYPCPILEERYQEMCYTYGVLSAFQTDLPKSIEVCSQIPEKLRSACFNTVGRDRTMWSADPVELNGQCEQIANADFQKECIEGVSYNLFIRFGTESQLPAEFCAAARTNNKTACYQQFSLAVKKITSDKNKIELICAQIKDSGFKNICLGQE